MRFWKFLLLFLFSDALWEFIGCRAIWAIFALLAMSVSLAKAKDPAALTFIAAAITVAGLSKQCRCKR